MYSSRLPYIFYSASATKSPLHIFASENYVSPDDFRFCFGWELCFETPIVLFFLSRIGVVSPQQLGRQRRYAIVVAFILGALITPTFDPINQTLVALPIIVLYEVGIWLAKFGARQRKPPTCERNLAKHCPLCR